MAGRAPVTPGAGGGAPGAVLAFGLTAALGGAAGAPGAVLAFGLTAALGGGGGAPLAPGTGNALVLGKGWVDGSAAGAFAGCSAFGRPACPAGAPGKPVLTAGLIVALGGTGALPCWISVARCATAGGRVDVAPCPGATAPGEPGRPPSLSPGPAAGGGGPRLLMTLSITARLWMLAKMTLLGGGAT